MAKGIKTIATVVRACDDIGPNVRRLILEDPDGWELPPFYHGAHIDLHLEKNLVRTYSLCNDPREKTQYVIAVKREPNSRGGSHFIHNNITVGSNIGVSLPRGGVHATDDVRNIFIVGGIGITPFISTIQSMVTRGRTNFELHYVSRGEPILIDDIRSASEPGLVKIYDTLVDARPDLKVIVESSAANARFFCCGPTTMIDAFEQATSTLPATRLHVEHFTAAKLASSADAMPYELVLAQSQKSIIVTPELGLRGALEELDADVAFSCESGICGACRTRWIDGQPVHRDRVLSQAERERELIACVAECRSKRLVLDL
jgi:ferredoxin-NADP reductase